MEQEGIILFQIFEYKGVIHMEMRQQVVRRFARGQNGQQRLYARLRDR